MKTLATIATGTVSDLLTRAAVAAIETAVRAYARAPLDDRDLRTIATIPGGLDDFVEVQ